MLVAGVIAEYNPFHNGHARQLRMTREAGATHIVAVMSGDSVQRGEAAIYSKYDRAKAALDNGCDLVIELPTPYSCSNGEVFAKSAVEIFAGLGENAVQMLSFGCESGDTAEIEKAADIADKLMLSDEVKNYLGEGKTYPEAIQLAADNLCSDTAKVFHDPNGILAIEYIRAIRKYAAWIKPYAVKRQGVSHDCDYVNGEYASASQIRKIIREGEDVKKLIPYDVSKLVPADMRNMDKAILYKLCCGEKSDFMLLPDSNESIANRFLSVLESLPYSTEDFLQKVKSKNITMARLRRMVYHFALGVTKDDIQAVPYGRIIGLNSRGCEILGAAKNRTLEYDTSLKRLESISSHAARISHLEQNAVRFREMSSVGKPISNEYKIKTAVKK